jgi:DNA polymerase-3 subunit delta
VILRDSGLEKFVASPAPDTVFLLLYGPDDGLVRDRAEKAVKAVAEDLRDPFRVADFDASDLKDDPARLNDEAFAMALTGGRRAIRVRNGADHLVGALTDILEAGSCENLVVVEAGNLAKGSKLRKLAEDNKAAVAGPCYGDSEQDRAGLLQKLLKENGYSVSRDAVEWILAHTGSDRKATLGEYEKLMLYMGEEKAIELDHAMACFGDSSATALDDVVQAAAGGKPVDLEVSIQALMSEGMSVIPIILAVQRHLHKLHFAAGMMRQGASADQAIGAIRPPVFFKTKPLIRHQLDIWNVDRLATALSLLTEAELDAKTTGRPDEAICHRALMRICQAARAGMRRR